MAQGTTSPQITADLLSNGIDVYPQKEFDEDAEDRLVNEKFRVSGSVQGLCTGPLDACGGVDRALLPPPGRLGETVG